MTSRLRSTYWFCCLAFGVALSAWAQIPPESQWRLNLPDRVIPGESELPRAIVKPLFPKVPTEAALPDDPRADIKLWLKLKSEGHLARVKALQFSPDGRRLYSGGHDKIMIAWRNWAKDKKVDLWAYESTGRWQISRGPRGHINAIAACENLTAIGGYGAEGAAGEIILFDAITGGFRQALVLPKIGHQTTISNLRFCDRAAKASPLVSQDLDGKVILWKQDKKSGKWGGKVIVPADDATFAKASQRQRHDIATMRRMSALAATPTHIYVPFVKSYKGPEKNIRWAIYQIDIETGKKKELSKQTFAGTVVAMDVAADNSVLVGANYLGEVYTWNLKTGDVAQLAASPFAVSLDLSDNGRWLVVGTNSYYAEDAGDNDPPVDASCELWNLAAAERVFALRSPAYFAACSVSNDGSRVAYASGNEVTIVAANGKEQAVLNSQTKPIHTAAFLNDKKNPYHIALAPTADEEGVPIYSQVFDTTKLQLVGKPKPKDRFTMWNVGQGDWSLQWVENKGLWQQWLKEGNEQQARVPFNRDIDGNVSTWCFLPDEKGKPFAVVIGAGDTGNIAVCKLEKVEREKTAPIIRLFRGHNSGINSLNVSRDRRYLLSSSSDATVRLWKIEDIAKKSLQMNRWGAEFKAEDGKVVVTSAPDDGPLYFRGVREGDTIDKLLWAESSAEGDEDDDTVKTKFTVEPKEIIARLDSDSIVQYGFETSRAGVARPVFQSLPAWQSIVNFTVADDGEWAYWSPAGYYDASFAGHKLFGWQVNNDVDAAPDFSLADRYRKRLERPRVMQQLLKTGSLDAAFAIAKLPAPFEQSQTLAQNYTAKPEIEILAPPANEPIVGEETIVEAKVTIPSGRKLVPPKAFVNGVTAINRELVSQVKDEKSNTLISHFRWRARLPAEKELVLQVSASTDAEVADLNTQVYQRAGEIRKPTGRLYIIGAGVNEYRDASIGDLKFAVNNAKTIVNLLKENADYADCEATMLLDQSVTRSHWKIIASQYAEKLKAKVTPDDLIVFFLSGHGVRDEMSGDYYYVGADARATDIANRKYHQCLSFAELSLFADVPCRKLAILDTCHSGSVQPLRQTNLKSALRMLQDDMIFTFTASEGRQTSVEVNGLSRFSLHLRDCLSGLDKSNTDGRITLQEAERYVTRQVTFDARLDNMPQRPTLGPKQLLRYVEVPLVKTP